MPAEAPPIVLSCGADVERRDGRFHAASREPWLVLPDHPALRAGRFVEIVYRLGLWDEPVRPVFRFVDAAGMITEALGAGPVAGAACWIGRIPRGTCRIEISPTCRPGPFDFEIESIRRRRLPRLLWHAARQAPRQTRSALLTRIIGWGPEAEENFRWAIGFTPMTDYPPWRMARKRPAALAGLERPRFDWAHGPTFDVVVGGQNGVARTLASLSAQVYPNRRVHFVPNPALPDADALMIDLDERGPADGAGAETPSFVLALAAGDVLAPDALACVAEAACRHPDVRLFYADEEHIDAGDVVRPNFKPRWSPVLFSGRPYLGRAVFVRRDLWAQFDPAERGRFMADAVLPARLVGALAPADVRALHRPLLAGAAQTTGAADEPRRRPSPQPGLRATIVIPTRDRAELLSRCLDSIRARPNVTAATIVIVDNGSTEAATRDLFRKLAGDPRIEILSRPGPFNYAALCNDGAAASDADVLVFLNNDTAARTPDWLDRLVGHALQPEVGAVGAKLLLPDGRIQHAGVVLGLGGLAGHFGALAAAGDPGWAGRHHMAHDVAAVTGACLAVARDKFAAVGGFDATDLPIELNDIDLCLKLAARGWGARLEPEVELLHEESASRGGATFRRRHVYADQRACFTARWRAVVRDDPFFHPGLSLFNVAGALG